ncbi:zinc ribbon domain-containing protein [Williamsia sp. MIQD14]|uniref:zinc ribbon domain-containing protein n=1 Tax=Williamsia sp. MIQD14 TaxID=3425703 RepID=UPI003DA015E4
MPLYGFRCDQGCGDAERAFSMASVPDRIACPGCGAVARRRFESIAVGHGRSAAMRLHDATAATADSPRVTSSVPPAGPGRTRRPVSTDPRHRRLPRP